MQGYGTGVIRATVTEEVRSSLFMLALVENEAIMAMVGEVAAESTHAVSLMCVLSGLIAHSFTGASPAVCPWIPKWSA